MASILALPCYSLVVVEHYSIIKSIQNVNETRQAVEIDCKFLTSSDRIKQYFIEVHRGVIFTIRPDIGLPDI